MHIVPRFTADFLKSVDPQSPEELFVRSLLIIDSAYQYSTIFDDYHHAWFKDFVTEQDEPLYVIGGQLSYGPQPSEEVVSAKWKKRLLQHGKIGEIVVNAIGGLKTSSDLLLGKSIDFCIPYKRKLNPNTGYINGNLIDYAPGIQNDPSLFIQIGDERVTGAGIHFPILSLCAISIR